MDQLPYAWFDPTFFPFYDPIGRPHDIPPVGIFDEPTVNICVNSQWMSSLAAGIERFIYTDAWNGTDDEKAAAINQVLSLLGRIGDPGRIGECNDMANGCCYDDVQRRLDQYGNSEISINGGDWQQDPNDPRNAVPKLPPPVIDVDHSKCDAATNGQVHLKDMVEEVASHLEVGESATALVGIILAIIFVLADVSIIGALVTPLLIQAAATMIGMGKDAYLAYFTSDVWSQVLCALYCSLDENGVLSPAAYSAFLSTLGSDLPASPAKDAFLNKIKSAGYRWMYNQCSFGTSANADCGDCGCGCGSFWVVSFGVDPVITTDYIEGTAIQDAHGSYYLEFHTTDKTKGCTSNSEGIFGDATVICAIAPPLDFVEDNEDCSIIGDYCANFWGFSGNAPFRIRINFVEDCS